MAAALTQASVCPNQGSSHPFTQTYLTAVSTSETGDVQSVALNSELRWQTVVNKPLQNTMMFENRNVYKLC